MHQWPMMRSARELEPRSSKKDNRFQATAWRVEGLRYPWCKAKCFAFALTSLQPFQQQVLDVLSGLHHRGAVGLPSMSCSDPALCLACWSAAAQPKPAR